MPELPEVEGFRAFFERHVAGRVITKARALDSWMLKDVTRAAFARHLSGRTISAVDRRGKIMIAFTEPRPGEPDAPALALHYGMNGRPLIAESSAPIHTADRMVLDLDDGMSFRYRNVRRLGFIKLMPRSRLSDLLWGLGPDPIEAPLPWFRETLAARQGPVKAVLLDQTFVAGIGNIYADEMLFAVGIRPDRPAANVTAEEAKRLHEAMRRILQRAVEHNLRQTMAPGRWKVPRRAGAPCKRCGRPVSAQTIGGRTAYFCRSCQK